MRLAALAVVGAVVVGAACGNDVYGTGGGGCIPVGARVCMEKLAFDPATLQVAPGTVVTWQNGDGVSHTVTSNPGETETFNATVPPSGAFTYQFNAFNDVDYHCTIHGSPTTGMRGRILVKQ